MIFHRTQRDFSHSPGYRGRDKLPHMNEGEIFRANLLRLMAERGLEEATVSKAANLNPRAVTDIREGRVQSPKLSTVFAIAKALGEDPAEMLGLGKRYKLNADLAAFLGQFEEQDQERFLSALKVLARPPA